MDRNERRTCWISGWIGLDLSFWRLSSMEVVWFLITSDLNVSRSRLSSGTATISWSACDKSCRCETTDDSSIWEFPNPCRNPVRTAVPIVGTPEWLSWLFLVFFFSALSGSMLFVEKLSLRRRCCFCPSFVKYGSSTSSSLWHRKDNVDPKWITRRHTTRTDISWWRTREMRRSCSVTGLISSLLTLFESPFTEPRRHES